MPASLNDIECLSTSTPNQFLPLYFLRVCNGRLDCATHYTHTHTLYLLPSDTHVRISTINCLNRLQSSTKSKSESKRKNKREIKCTAHMLFGTCFPFSPRAHIHSPFERKSIFSSSPLRQHWYGTVRLASVPYSIVSLIYIAVIRVKLPCDFMCYNQTNDDNNNEQRKREFYIHRESLFLLSSFFFSHYFSCIQFRFTNICKCD